MEARNVKESRIYEITKWEKLKDHEDLEVCISEIFIKTFGVISDLLTHLALWVVKQYLT